MKKLLILLLVVLIVAPVFAERSAFLQDIGIRLGHGSFLNDGSTMHVLGGLTIGLTNRIEFNPQVIVALTPVPFEKVNLGAEFGYSVLGNRVNNNDVTGPIMNTIVSLGFFTENFKPRYITLRITPITLGSTYSGKRENILPVGIAWDFAENKFSCFFSVAIFDHYIKGTWTQLRGE